MNQQIKVLSVKQPFADAIVNGVKLVENRSRSTTFRGKLFIHSSKSKPTQTDLRYCRQRGFNYDEERSYFGCILGSIELVDVRIDEELPWAIPSHYHWILENPRKLKVPIFCKGSLGLWTPPPEVIAQLQPTPVKPTPVKSKPIQFNQLALF